jgi:hypothetical protein
MNKKYNLKKISTSAILIILFIITIYYISVKSYNISKKQAEESIQKIQMHDFK